jgi:DNA-directed DNA polymerase III PolC
VRLPEEATLHNHYLQWLCFRGWDERGIEQRAEKVAAEHDRDLDEQRAIYRKRLLHELDALERQHFVDYILIVYDLINWCRRNDIMTGPGRGSSAGSLVCFLLGITSIDPIEHALLFERFISPDRIDMPDVDMDFEDTRREEVVAYLQQRYGEENVAQIATVMTLKGKSALKDVGRVFEVSYDEINKITSAIISRAAGDERVDNTIEDSFKESAACQAFAERHPDTFRYAMAAEGLHRQMGVHAAGVVTSPVPIIGIVPIEARFEDGKALKVTSVDKDAVEQLGLLKLDVLGLKTLSQIKSTLRAVKERHGDVIDMEKLELDDKHVLKRFTNQEFVGVFQFDSTSVIKFTEGVKFTHFEDLTAVNALNRPGTTRSGITTVWARRKMGKEEVEELHPIVDFITKDTMGLIVYQEQVARIFVEVGGYTPGEADKIRKLMAKSKGVELVGKEKPKFMTGAEERGFDPKLAAQLFNAVQKFGAYGFNKSHSAAYAAISYWQMWLKHYYPIEFMWALLRHEDKVENIGKYVKEAKRLGIEVLPPNVNQSKDTWTMVGENTITASLGDVNGVGENAAREVLKVQPFSSLKDFLARVNRRVVNRKVVSVLVLADAMRDFIPNKKAFVDNAEEICGAKDPDIAYQKHSSEPDFSHDEALVQRMRVCPIAMGEHPLSAYVETMAAMGPHVKWDSFEDIVWDNRMGFFRGVLTNFKVSRINEKTDKSYAHLTFEDEHEQTVRGKLDVENFDQYRYLLDRGEGTCIAFAAIRGKTEQLKVCFAVDLEDLRQLRRDGKPWTGIASWFAESPVLKHGAPPADINLVIAKKMPKKGGKLKLVAIVAAVHEHKDKKDKTMAFIDLAGYQGSVPVLCFGSSYPAYEKALKPGNVLSVELVRGDRQTLILDSADGCHVAILEKLPLRIELGEAA